MTKRQDWSHIAERISEEPESFGRNFSTVAASTWLRVASLTAPIQPHLPSQPWSFKISCYVNIQGWVNSVLLTLPWLPNWEPTKISWKGEEWNIKSGSSTLQQLNLLWSTSSPAPQNPQSASFRTSFLCVSKVYSEITLRFSSLFFPSSSKLWFSIDRNPQNKIRARLKRAEIRKKWGKK